MAFWVGLEKIFSVSSISMSLPGLPVASRLKNAGLIADPGRLLHVVRDDDDGVVLLELSDQVLDRQRGDRVQRRARLVHQQHVGLHRDRAGDAQPLLLTTGEPAAGLVEPVLDLVPQVRAPQRPLGHLVEGFLLRTPCSFRPATTLSSMDMVGNGFGRWNTMPIVLRTLTGSMPGTVDVLAVEQHRTLDAGARESPRASG